MEQSKNRRRPAQSVAMKYLRAYICTNTLKLGDPLPSTRTLAAMADVSYVTLCQALQELAISGEVSFQGKRRYLVAREGMSLRLDYHKPSASTSPSTLRPWQRVADSIILDIVNGVFKSGRELPPKKELGHRYSVSYRTLMLGLNKLLRESILSQLPNGGYAVASLSLNSKKSRLVCFVQSIDSYSIDFSQHDEALFRELETQCEQSRIKFDVYLVFAVMEILDHRLRHKDTGKIMDTADVVAADDFSILGYAYFIPWEPEKVDRRTIIALEGLKKPIVVIDETGLLSLPAPLEKSRWLRKLTVATSLKPAQDVARYLLRLGHRTIAFFSADHQFVWSQRRLQGLQEEYASVNGSVEVFTEESEPYPFTNTLKHCGFDSFDKFYAQWRETLQAPFQTEIDRAIERLRIDTPQSAQQRLTLVPMLEEAIKQPEITAWVMVNDFLASIARDFLKEKKVRVPADLSLISFDDSREALRNNLSSYNFNPSAVVASLLGFVLNRKPYSQSDVNVAGFIVDRGSIAVARK